MLFSSTSPHPSGLFIGVFCLLPFQTDSDVPLSLIYFWSDKTYLRALNTLEQYCMSLLYSVI